MADTAFSVSSIPPIGIPIGALDRAATALTNLSDFWPGLAESITDKAQRSWPLKRRSGRLRRSLTWSGRGLGKGGRYEPSSDSLIVGTRIFYGAFSHFGTKNQPTRVLLGVDPLDTTKRLEKWARDRVIGAGLEVR